MIWLLILAYLAVGAAIVAWMCGASKTSNAWSATQAWDQVTSEGWSAGSLLWVGIMVGWLPIAGFFISRYVLWKITGYPK